MTLASLLHFSRPRLVACLTLAGGLALVPAFARAQAPATAPTGEPTLTTADTTNAAAWMRGRAAWTSSRRSFAVGDIITVLVDEYTLASANKGVTATDRRRRDAGVRLQAPGSAGAPGMSMNGGFSTNNDGESVQRGENVRRNAFRSELSVRVLEVSPTGMLRIAGSKAVTVDEDEQDISLTGWVRPQDVSAQNVVVSERIADAEINYAASGGLGKPKGGIIGRVISMIWP